MNEGDLYLDLGWPGLRRDGYQLTSPDTPRYNCIAWAAGEEERWWWPEEDAYWPEGIPHEATLPAFEALFRSLGYEPCDGASFEPGHAKVAVFAREDGEPTHAARQLDDGRWTSKLGKRQDITHELASLEGDAYGRIRLVMRRPAALDPDAAQGYHGGGSSKVASHPKDTLGRFSPR